VYKQLRKFPLSLLCFIAAHQRNFHTHAVNQQTQFDYIVSVLLYSTLMVVTEATET